MKKSFAVLALVLVCAMLVPCFASAVSFTAQADAMKDMGLFLGTNNGYDLDKAPTRAQAAVMLVRFLGKEAEAKAGEWETPFTDVPDWAKPYVGYLYENDLTKGMSETTFVPDDVCSAQMYVTFILRALGYMDENGKDTFEYAKVFDFAEEKNLITAENCDKDNFLRDHMVGIAYKALTLPTADAAYDALVKKLAADGVVTEEQAAKVVDGSYIPEEGGEGGEVELDPSKATILNMAWNSIYLSQGFAENATSLIDAWDGTNDKAFNRGFLWAVAASDYSVIENAIIESSNGAICHGKHGDFPMANTDNVYIYNGKPGDADFGTTLSANLYEEFGGCLAGCGNAAGTGDYNVWVGNLWKKAEDKTLEDGYYTFVLYLEDGTSYAFYEYIIQNVFEESHQRDYTF